MNISKLIFFPESTEKTIDKQTLLTALINLQFIVAERHEKNHYLPGDFFLSSITFLGCSPNINLMPVEGETHCFISIIEQTDDIKCLGYTQTINPKCPDCKKRINNWKIPEWQLAGAVCTCDKCQAQSPYAELNWKHECGFARCGFEVSHIYPHEALPTDQFLEKLRLASSFDWDYCYANDGMV